MGVFPNHLVLVGAVVLGMLLPCGARAQSQEMATPGPFPQAPDAAACVTEALTVEDVLAALSAPAATPAVATPDVVVERGTAADAATADAVKATLLQVFACANAGDPLRFASLYTDSFLRDFFGGVPQADLEAFLGLEPQPLPAEQRRIIRGIGDVELLPDGRARVVIILDEPDDPRTEEPDTVILRQVEGRWLVDEIREDATSGN
jgi:sulfur carrier protein ThiS